MIYDFCLDGMGLEGRRFQLMRVLSDALLLSELQRYVGTQLL